MTDGFYRALEDRFRGSRDLIRTRVSVYLPFITPLIEHYPDATLLDLGCGRGEWLEIASSHGFAARGVEQDAGMLAASIEHGCDVVQGDALAFLESLPDESVTVVSAIHVIEHMDFDQLRKMVTEAHRVLHPGGIMILETPNPENIVVATCNFYLDPTHRRPIPPSLLSFVSEYAGFVRIKTLRLQEPAELHLPDTQLELFNVLASASPDYAIVAQKAAAPAVLECNETPFNARYGITVQELASRYDRQPRLIAEILRWIGSMVDRMIPRSLK